ncbi:MAG: Fic family protein [Spirochaetaceae bacterium]|jgi:Fic family protein|nr:Fic family protein [Spirochaetaceae bacterium]
MRDIKTPIPLLPPDLKKVETTAILRKEAKARATLAELKGFAPTIPNQNILINAIALQEAKESSAIENIVTTQDELYKNLTIKSSAMDSSAKEVINYREAVYKGCDIIKMRRLISVSDVIKIQETIIKNNAGIRKLPGTSLVNSATNEIVYTPPQDYRELCYLLDNFCTYLNDDEDSLWKMAVLHYQFETIHPFYDGNGRTGRILNILYLLLKKHIDTPILYLSSYIIKNKSEYYTLLQEVRETNVWENWCFFILEGIEETAKQTLEKVKSIKDLLELTLEKVKEHCPKIYSKELVEIIFENPYSKIDFVVNKLDINRKTASKYLKELEENNFLSPLRVGKEIIYINSHLMEMLKK